MGSERESLALGFIRLSPVLEQTQTVTRARNGLFGVLPMAPEISFGADSGVRFVAHRVAPGECIQLLEKVQQRSHRLHQKSMIHD